MNPKDDQKNSEEALKAQNLENNPSPIKKNDKEDLPRSSTNKSGKNGG